MVGETRIYVLVRDDLYFSVWTRVGMPRDRVIALARAALEQLVRGNPDLL
jgi:hypothetical protein